MADILEITRPSATELPMESDLLPTTEVYSETTGCATTSPTSSNSRVNQVASLISSRHHSPARSGITTLTSVSATPPPPDFTPIERSGPPPAKRRKLTETEKAQRRVQKADRDQQRAIEKAKKDEEKLRKDEERRVKNEEQEEKRRERELLKRQKDLERQRKANELELKKKEKEEEVKRKQDEIDKKARAQSRINAFFARPKTDAPKEEAAKVLGSNSALNQDQSRINFTESQPADTSSDYLREFPPLPLAPGTSWAPHNQFSWDDDAKAYAEYRMNESLFLGPSPQTVVPALSESLTVFRGIGEAKPVALPSVALLLASIQGSNSNPLVATSTPEKEQQVERVIRKLPLKYMFFSVDVRPPYIGTNTSLRSVKSALQLARNPLKRSHDELDYDYDSEAEWEEPEEGEDLGSENESIGDPADEDDLDGFLDDEEDAQLQRPRALAANAIEPVSSGLCWETSDRADRRSEAYEQLRQYRMEVLKDGLKTPIDPWTSSYWEVDQIKPPANITGAKPTTSASRSPLKTLPSSTSNSSLTSSGNVLGILGKPVTSAVMTKKANASWPAADLELFKDAVRTSDLSKVGLLAVLKSKFPKKTNAVLKETLETIASRVGSKSDEKRWIIVGETQSAS